MPTPTPYGGTHLELHPGPFSLPLPPTRLRLVAASSAAELSSLHASGSALLLHGEIAAEQLTPRGYPFYENPAHAEILDAISSAQPVAVIAATGKNPGTTAALSPFPLVEDGTFPLPSAYLAEEDLAPLLEAVRSGDEVDIAIDSDRFTATGEQAVGLLGTSNAAQRVIVCAHVDTKPDTPGALDNATGVAVVLAAAELLASDPPHGLSIEFLPFNGEDHYAAPGEMAYLAAHPPGDDIALVINIDGAGLRGGASAISTYELSPEMESAVTTLLESHPDVARGPSWFASDHAIFAMQGIPSVAVTSAELETVVMESVAHTPADIPDLVDAEVLAQTAHFIAELVRAIARTHAA